MLANIRTEAGKIVVKAWEADAIRKRAEIDGRQAALNVDDMIRTQLATVVPH
jgi:hypothetical protein